MSKLFIVTGSSKGLGKALVKLLVAEGKVIGLSRTNTFHHKNFSWIPADLSRPLNLEDIELDLKAEEIILINNAGSIGPITTIGKQSSKELIDVMNINVTSLMVLSNRIISWVKQHGKKATIINISSGASSHPIEGWSAYCSSKAAVDMFSFTLKEEMKRAKLPVRVYALAPGVVDSSMQEKIRESSVENFPRVAEFQEMKKTGELASPEEVAGKVVYLYHHPELFPEVKCSVRDF